MKACKTRDILRKIKQSTFMTTVNFLVHPIHFILCTMFKFYKNKQKKWYQLDVLL